MARTCAVQPDIEATIRSPRSLLRWPKRGLALTARAMHSVAERMSGCIAALFYSMDKFGESLGSRFGPVAAVTTSAAAASGARIMACPSPARPVYRPAQGRAAEKIHQMSRDPTPIVRANSIGRPCPRRALWNLTVSGGVDLRYGPQPPEGDNDATRSSAGDLAGAGAPRRHERRRRATTAACPRRAAARPTGEGATDSLRTGRQGRAQLARAGGEAAEQRGVRQRRARGSGCAIIEIGRAHV